MKKLISLMIVACVLMCSLNAFAVAETIVINGEVVTIPSDMGTVCEKDDRTFVPIRFVSEYLGCTVNYQETNHTNDGKSEVKATATITNADKSLSYFVTVGDNKLYTIGSTINITEMDTEVFVNNEEGRMYIPVRFFAEAMGYTVGWDEATQTVTLDKAL